MSGAAAGSSGERAEKRARVDAAAASGSQASGPFDALPDSILAIAFGTLGARGSWPLRGVCRRWRQLVEEMEWKELDLRIMGCNQATRADSNDALCALSAAFETRKLRLAEGASFSLRPELSRAAVVNVRPDGGASVAAARQSHRRTLEGACSVLEAVARSHAGPRQPREVLVELCRGNPDPFVRGGGEDSRFLIDFLLGVLRALRPYPPGGAASGLRSLSFAVTSDDKTFYGASARMPWPEAADLRAALAPFGGALRSLVLFFGELDAGATPEIAAAIADACPLLTSLSLRPNDKAGSLVLGQLARLGGLEHLSLISAQAPSVSLGDGVAALARGPAGRELRSLRLVEGTLYATGEFSKRREKAGRPGPSLAAPQDIEVDRLADPAALLALGRAAKLREAAFELSSFSLIPSVNAPALRHLAAALSCLPLLESFSLKLDFLVADPEDVVAFLRSAGARRALVELDLQVFRQLEEAEAAAMATLPALQRLRVSSALASPASVRAFEVLAGLAPGVAVGLDFSRLGLNMEAGAMGRHAFAEAEAFVRGLFAGRPLLECERSRLPAAAFS
eukprot:tig00020816_g14196.t1